MSNAHLYVAVREAAAGTFDVLGELGAGANGGVVYLAREIAGGALVVLKLEPGDDGAGGAQYFLDVATTLDASVPDVEMRCPKCRAKLRQWARFCTQCGLDVSGEAPASGEQASRAALREKVRAATEGAYEFLGDIPRAEGGGLVYFARDLTDGKIVALRLQKDMNKRFEVGVTRTLKAVERGEASPPPRGAAVTIIQRTPMPQRTAPQPNVAGGQAAARPLSPLPALPTAKRWRLGRAEIAAVIAVFLIIVLILTQL
ncbi:MAG TPA: zinc ribbon domain-containing protein [Gemmatimonadaceae bacterium]|nr:zinc ribbon domain-containing protein [Gemmatimonadaceae bacterium]